MFVWILIDELSDVGIGLILVVDCKRLLSGPASAFRRWPLILIEKHTLKFSCKAGLKPI